MYEFRTTRNQNFKTFKFWMAFRFGRSDFEPPHSGQKTNHCAPLRQKNYVGKRSTSNAYYPLLGIDFFMVWAFSCFGFLLDARKFEISFYEYNICFVPHYKKNYLHIANTHSWWLTQTLINEAKILIYWAGVLLETNNKNDNNPTQSVWVFVVFNTS